MLSACTSCLYSDKTYMDTVYNHVDVLITTLLYVDEPKFCLCDNVT